MDPVTILTTEAQIKQLTAELEQCRVFAVDLEADSMHSYQEKVCLLQFTYGADDTTVLVDPLAVTDLSPLRPVLANREIRKIFHAADYDIRCLNRDFSIEINGLFDTMICCQFLGEERVGLADALGKYFSVTLDKQYQRADWSRRPLSAEMCNYAAEDTRHLQPLAMVLEQQLRDKDRLWWVEEEFRLLEQVRFSGHDGPAFLRIKGAGTLSPRSLAVLENLLNWRETEAERRDCPPYKVMGNKILLAIAAACPESEESLHKIAEFPPRLIQRYGKAVFKNAIEAMAVAVENLPHYPRPPRRERDPAADKRFTLLKQWRKSKAQQLQLDPGVLINNATLENIARQQPDSIDQLENKVGLKQWQCRVLGAELLECLQA